MKHTVAIAFGNPLMGDEGIGAKVLEGLIQQQEKFPGVEFMDLGTSGATLLHMIANRQKAVIVDCTLFNAPPGTMRRFTPHDVRNRKVSAQLSLHEGNVLDILKLSEQLGESPKEVVIFGIQPKEVAIKEGLSPELEEKLQDYIEEIARELSRTEKTVS